MKALVGLCKYLSGERLTTFLLAKNFEVIYLRTLSSAFSLFSICSLLPLALWKLVVSVVFNGSLLYKKAVTLAALKGGSLEDVYGVFKRSSISLDSWAQSCMVRFIFSGRSKPNYYRIATWLSFCAVGDYSNLWVNLRVSSLNDYFDMLSKGPSCVGWMELDLTFKVAFWRIYSAVLRVSGLWIKDFIFLAFC